MFKPGSFDLISETTLKLGADPSGVALKLGGMSPTQDQLPSVAPISASLAFSAPKPQ